MSTGPSRLLNATWTGVGQDFTSERDIRAEKINSKAEGFGRASNVEDCSFADS
jgi:hypothetical protein